MTNRFAGNIVLAAVLLIQIPLWAQNRSEDAFKIKKITEERFRYTGSEDSIAVHHKTFDYDEAGCLMAKQEFYYNAKPEGTLAKDVNAQYDKTKQLLLENIIVFKPNGDKEFENLRTKYLVYAPNEENSKYVWRQYIDNSLDIVREDTLTYNADQNLIKRCDYNYKGNTSLYCDEYDVDKDGKLLRWRMYSHWTTVKAGGKPVTKREKKQDYKYSYNSKGQPTKIKGKRYTVKYLAEWAYDKNNVLVHYVESSTKKRKNTKKRRKETGERFFIEEEIRERNFNGKGMLLSETFSRQGIIEQESKYAYESDTLLINQELLQKGIIYRKVEFFYENSQTLNKKLTYSYDNKGIMRFVIQSDYNDKNQLILEEQRVKEEVVNSMIFEYNEQGDKISATMFHKNGKKVEKTLYFYEYY